MTGRTAALIVALAVGHATAWAQTAPPNMDEPVVYAGVFITGPDSRTRTGTGAALDTGDRVGADVAGTVYLAPCSTVGASGRGRPIAASATEAWQLSGKVLELGAEQASIQVVWQRVRRNGQDDASPPQSLSLTLARGERKTLDNVAVPATGLCAERYAVFDVAFISRREVFAPIWNVDSASIANGDGGQTKTTVADSRAGATSMAAGSARQSGSAASTVPSPTTQQIERARAEVASLLQRYQPAFPDVRKAQQRLRELEAQAQAEAQATITADLWLVRSTPGRADETQHLTSLVSALPRPFAFAPIAIQTANGALTVKVEGSVEKGQAPDGSLRFYFSANRTVTFAPANRPARDTVARTVESSVKTSVTMPEPEDVLSFELPPLRIPGGAVVPDQLSIRVRLTPAPIEEKKVK